jgi:hypothetical protein
VPTRRAAPASITSETELADWEMVLYLGFADRRRQPRAAQAATAVAQPLPSSLRHAGDGAPAVNGARPGP